MTATGLTWSLIGASDIASTRTLPAIRRTGGTISAVYSRNDAHGAAYAARHEIPRHTSHLEEAFAPEVDAVYISSTNQLHALQGLAALNAGKHVLIEKPMALSVQDARVMVDAAHDRGLVLAVNHHLPGSPLHQAAARLVREGAIGEVMSARIRHAVMLPERLRGWRVSDSSADGGGVLFDVAIHDASALNALLGRPRRVLAAVSSRAPWTGEGVEDTAMMIIEYEDAQGRAVLAQTHDAYGVSDDPTTLELQGTAGWLTITDAMTQDTLGSLTLHADGGSRTIPVDVRSDLYDLIIEHFDRAVRGEGEPTVTGGQGIEALRVILGAHESARTGRRIEL